MAGRQLKAVTRFLPSPATLGAAAVLTALLGGPARVRRLSPLQRIVALIALLNWRSWPLFWHYQLWGLVPWIHWRYRVSPGLMKCFSIAQDPFERKVTYKGFVTFDQGDWNKHLSNTSYGKIIDIVRFKAILEVTGPAFGEERAWSPLGATSYAFLREIPMLTAYEVDMHIASWDDKWIYWISRFTTAGRTRSSPRILNCVALSRSCFKLVGSGLSIPPARILSLSGVGPSLANWERTLELRKEKKGREWLMWGGREIARKKRGEAIADTDKLGEELGWAEDGMETYEERRKERLAIVKRFGDPDFEDWKEL